MAAGTLAPKAGVPPTVGANAKVPDPVFAWTPPKLKPPVDGALGALKLKPELGAADPNADPVELAEKTNENLKKIRQPA